jgi:hypothetical protein
MNEPSQLDRTFQIILKRMIETGHLKLLSDTIEGVMTRAAIGFQRTVK